MASTPRRLVHFASEVAEHDIGSPYSDTGSSESQNASSTVQYINSQLVAHGFAQAPGLSTEGLSKKDEERLVKCIMGMLGQRMEDMSRAEDLTTKLRTLSYENERLSSMHSAVLERVASAEKNVSLYKTRMATTDKTLQAVQTAHKLTSAELQRTRTTLQGVRQTHTAELKRREKENERMLERWSRLAENQLKLATVSSGLSFRPPHAYAQPIAGIRQHMLANANVASKDGDVIGKASNLLESALEDAEQTRRGLEEENRRLKAVIQDCANQLGRLLYSATQRSGQACDEPPLFTTAMLFPLGSTGKASEELDTLIASLREQVLQLGQPGADYELRQVENNASSSKTHAQATLDSEARADIRYLTRENERLQTVVRELRNEIKKSRESATSYSGKVTALFQTINDEDKINPSEGKGLALISGTTTPPLQEPEPDLHQYLPNDADFEPEDLPPASALVSPPRPQRKSVRIKSPARRSPARSRAPPINPGKALRSPRRGGCSGKSISQIMNSLAGSKRVVPAFETEVVPAGSGFVSSAFVLPPPSPMATLPQRGDLLSSLAPVLKPSLSDGGSSKMEIGNACSEAVQPPEPAGEATTSPTPPPPHPTGPRRPFNLPVAKPFAQVVAHAYSPARPSPLSRILMLGDSPEVSSSTNGLVAASGDADDGNDNSNGGWEDVKQGFAPDGMHEEVADGVGGLAPGTGTHLELLNDGHLNLGDLQSRSGALGQSGSDGSDGEDSEESPLKEKQLKLKALAAASAKARPTSIRDKLQGAQGGMIVDKRREKVKSKSKPNSATSTTNAKARKTEKENAHAARPPLAGDTALPARAPSRTDLPQPRPRSRSSKLRISPPDDPGLTQGSAAEGGVAVDARSKTGGGEKSQRTAKGGARRVPIDSVDAAPIGSSWK